MTQADLGAASVPTARNRPRVVPATLISIAPAFYRHTNRAIHLACLGVAAAVWLTLALALGPVGPSVNDDLTAATRARTSLRYDRALNWYARAEATAPSDPRPYCLTGQVRGLQGEWSLAATAYQTCLSLHPADVASAWLGLGDVHSAAGDTGGALSAWQRSADAGGKDALRRLGSAYEASGNADAAVSAWRRLPASDSEAHAHLGMLALWHGDLKTAHAEFVAANARPSEASQALANDGFLVLASRSSLDGDAWGRLGYAFLGAGLPALALTPLQTATRLDPQGDSAHAYLGWTLWLLSQQGLTPNGTPASYAANAQRELSTALALNDVDSFAWYAAGTIAATNGALATAQTDLAKAVALDAKNPAVWSAAAQVAVARADYLDAELDFGTAAQLSTRPDESIALLHLYADHGYGLETGRALAAAATATQRWPANGTIRFLQAQIADEAGKSDLASDAAQQAILLAPTDPAAYVLLGRYAAASGRYVAAAGYLRVALALAPHGPWAAQATQLLMPLQSLAV